MGVCEGEGWVGVNGEGVWKWGGVCVCKWEEGEGVWKGGVSKGKGRGYMEAQFSLTDVPSYRAELVPISGPG